MPHRGEARLDVRSLDELVGKLVGKKLANSTSRVYASGQRRYLVFCKAGGFTPVPTSEALLCRFVAQLQKDGLKHRSMKVYLAAVRFMHISEGRGNPFLSTPPCRGFTMPCEE